MEIIKNHLTSKRVRFCSSRSPLMHFWTMPRSFNGYISFFLPIEMSHGLLNWHFKLRNRLIFFLTIHHKASLGFHSNFPTFPKSFIHKTIYIRIQVVSSVACSYNSNQFGSVNQWSAQITQRTAPVGHLMNP